MTEIEAIYCMEESRGKTSCAECKFFGKVNCYKNACKKAIEALIRDIPKKLNGYSCPICYHYFEDGEIKNYCPNCGQKIDWSK